MERYSKGILSHLDTLLRSNIHPGRFNLFSGWVFGSDPLTSNRETGFQKILILGQAKTGTTALFYKIKNSMPSSTIALFEPRRIEAKHLHGNRPLLAKILFQPDLDIDYQSLEPFSKKILIVRDPRDKTISGILYRMRLFYSQDPEKTAPLLELLKEKEKSPRKVSLQQLLACRRRIFPNKPKAKANKLEDLFIRFRRDHPEYFVFKYEDFVENKLSGLEEYLGFPLSGEAKVPANLKHVERTKNHGYWRDWFLPEDVIFFRERFSPFLQEFGYSEDWNLHNPDALDPKHGSEYVQKDFHRKASLRKFHDLSRKIISMVRKLASTEQVLKR